MKPDTATAELAARSDDRPTAERTGWVYSGTAANPFPGGLGRVEIWIPPAGSPAADSGLEVQRRITRSGWLPAPYRIWDRTNDRLLPDIYDRRETAELAAERQAERPTGTADPE